MNTLLLFLCFLALIEICLILKLILEEVKKQKTTIKNYTKSQDQEILVAKFDIQSPPKQ